MQVYYVTSLILIVTNQCNQPNLLVKHWMSVFSQKLYTTCTNNVYTAKHFAAINISNIMNETVGRRWKLMYVQQNIVKMYLFKRLIYMSIFVACIRYFVSVMRRNVPYFELAYYMNFNFKRIFIFYSNV